MILIDANLLLYARIASFPRHAGAKQWLEERLNEPPRVALPWASLLAFLRLSTNRRVFEHPLSSYEAWRQIEEWLDLPNVWVPSPGTQHRVILGSLLSGGPLNAQLIPDAHLAAIAIEHGLILCSADGDFARFAGLRWENPLAQPPRNGAGPA